LRSSTSANEAWSFGIYQVKKFPSFSIFPTPKVPLPLYKFTDIEAQGLSAVACAGARAAPYLTMVLQKQRGNYAFAATRKPFCNEAAFWQVAWLLISPVFINYCQHPLSSGSRNKHTIYESDSNQQS
jgi:hypothetical protein